MHALLYKDFRVMWKQMKAFLLLIAIFCLIPNQALNLSAFFVVYAGLMLPMSLMSYFVVLLALVAALAGLAGAALPQGSILFLLGAPAALVLALLLCLASVPLSVRQYVKRLG